MMSDPTREDIARTLANVYEPQGYNVCTDDERAADAVLALFAPALRAAKAEAWLACADEARECGYVGAVDHEQLVDRDPYESEEGRHVDR